MPRAYLGLGANLGDRAANIHAALAHLGATSGITVVATSRLIETAPWGVTNQPDFLNAACALETTLDPHALKHACQAIEATLGRERSAEAERYGPRLIDLDLLLYDALVLDADGLTIPHPQVQNRAFVLEPLMDIAPDEVHPDLTENRTRLMGGVALTKVIANIGDLRSELASERAAGQSIGLVPTMGALHQGHLSLIERSAEENDITVVSVFVNPTQFNENTDFDTYPRTLDEDASLAEGAGAAYVFAPSADEMYASNRSTHVFVQALTDHLCGITRGQQHFAGVCLVVLKLFNIVQPDRAYFGQKDAQQALVVQRMVRDLNVPVDLVVCPIVREADGMALSSRNRLIPDEQRTSALRLREALVRGREMIRDGEQDARTLLNAMAEGIVMDPTISLDYLDIVSPETLEDKESVDDLVLIAGAIQVGDVRLIDNILVGPDGPWEDA